VFQLDRGLERGMTVLGVLHRLEEERLQKEEEGGTEEPPEADSFRDASAQRDAP